MNDWIHKLSNKIKMKYKLKLSPESEIFNSRFTVCPCRLD